MKRSAAVVLCMLLLGSLWLPWGRAAQPLEVSAACAILVDGETGRVLYAKQADECRPVASITKLMTALVAVESTPELGRMVTIRPEWTGIEGSSIYLRSGEQITLEGLLYGLLLASGNDAAMAIAGHCAGDVETFVTWMNERAEDLEMENTHFSNPSGLQDEGNYSTAADMAKLARAVMENATLAKMVATKSITIGGRSHTNHNKLLWQYEGCVGLKTGYTDLAGRTLVSCAQREGQRLIAVTLKAPNDWKDHAALYDYGFSRWTRQVLATAGKEAWQVPVIGSLARMAPVCTEQDVYYPLAQEEQVRAKIELARSVSAPVTKGEIAGSITFFLKDEPIGRTYLVYSQDVHLDTPRGTNLFQRLLRFFRGEK